MASAIRVACSGASVSKRRPKPPPRNVVLTAMASGAMPAIAAAWSRMFVGACVPVQIVSRPSRKSAVAVIGSMVACARYGARYSARSTPGPLSASSASPSSRSAICGVVVEGVGDAGEDRIRVGRVGRRDPSGRRRRRRRAWPPMCCARRRRRRRLCAGRGRRPASARPAPASKDSIGPPRCGFARTAAYSMPGRRTSMPKVAVPSHLGRPCRAGAASGRAGATRPGASAADRLAGRPAPPPRPARYRAGACRPAPARRRPRCAAPPPAGTPRRCAAASTSMARAAAPARRIFSKASTVEVEPPVSCMRMQARAELHRAESPRP